MGWEESVDDVMVLFCTVPDEQVGAAMARSLVGERLAACVNIIPGVRSIYRWQGEVCDDPEQLLVIKTVRGRMEALSQRVRALHPYETPELIALPVGAGLQDYLGWLREQTA